MAIEPPLGISPDIGGVDRDDKPRVAAASVPYRFAGFENIGLTIRTESNSPAALATAIRSAIRASDAELPIFNVRSMEDLRQASFWQFRIFACMFGIFGAAALFLAGVGVYGVLSFSVSQRTQEMGVRMALGARRSDVLSLVVRQGAVLAQVGVTAGLIGAFGVSCVISDRHRGHGELPASPSRHQRRSDHRAEERVAQSGPRHLADRAL